MKKHDAIIIAMLAAAVACGQAARVESGPGAGVRGTRVTPIAVVPVAVQPMAPVAVQPVGAGQAMPFRDAISNLCDAAGLDMSTPARLQVEAVVAVLNALAEQLRETGAVARGPQRLAVGMPWDDGPLEPGTEITYGELAAEIPATPLRASTSSRIKAWWARVLEKIREAFEDEDDDPVTPDPVTPIPTPDPIVPTPDPVTPDPVTPAGDNSFLWKPVSESRGGRCAVITPAKLTVKLVKINGVNHTLEYAGRANGKRQHFFQDATGAAFGRNVSVDAIDAGGAVLRKWVVPDGGARWASN